MTRAKMVRDDGVDHTWPPPMLTRPAKIARPRR
jgi:hypothetical protein